jgi:hypothetical protein
MDARRFDRLTLTLLDASNRRTVLGLGGAGLLGALSLDDADAKKRKKKKCKKCGPCKKCKKGKCRPKAAGTPCGESSQCFANGECVACDVCALGCPHSSVQAAVESANEGATIQVCPGTYGTNADILADVIERVTIVGAGSGNGGTVLDGQQRDSVILVRRGTHLELRRLTVTGGMAEYGGGISNARSTITLEDVHVTGNHASNGGGIGSDGNATLINSRVTDNSADVGGGIYNGGVSSGTLILTRGSLVTGNAGHQGSNPDGFTAGGIHNSSGTVTIIDGSRVTGNTPFDCAGTTAC